MYLILGRTNVILYRRILEKKWESVWKILMKGTMYYLKERSVIPELFLIPTIIIVFTIHIVEKIESKKKAKIFYKKGILPI